MLSLFNITQEIEAVVQVTQYVVVKTARNLFTVTRNKGDGVALVDELNRLFDVLDLNVKFLREFFNNVHRCSSSFLLGHRIYDWLSAVISSLVSSRHSPRESAASSDNGPKVMRSR